MNSLFDAPTVVVQGITGHHGQFHTRGMLNAGTRIVAGVTPGKAGQTIEGVPVYNDVASARVQHPAIDTSVIFVPARFARSAMCEALDAGIKLIVCITEGVPIRDMLDCLARANELGARIIGPNCPGLSVPGSHKLGIIADSITRPGSIAIVSRSGTLTYEIADALTKRGLGQRIILGIGGDPIQGSTFVDALEWFEQDAGTERIILVGEIGGTSEQAAADYIARSVTKPVYGLVVGHSAPPGQTFGHAGAIAGGAGEDAASKTAYLKKRDVTTATTVDELIAAIADELQTPEHDLTHI